MSARCVCARHDDGSVTTFLCPLHAVTDPCLTMAAVTGKRRTGTIRRGVCTSCGWGERPTRHGPLVDDCQRCDAAHEIAYRAWRAGDLTAREFTAECARIAEQHPRGTRAREDLRPGDQFTRPLPQMKGKPRLVQYTVTGQSNYKGRAFVEVRSDVQGAGSFALDALPEHVALTDSVRTP